MSGDEDSDVPSLVDIGDIQNLKPKEVIPVNNINGLKEKLQEIKVNLDWVESLEVIVDPKAFETQDLIVQPNASLQDKQEKAEHDFKREMSFYNQAKAAVEEGISRLKNMNIPTKRPEDYFAEMAKSDAHMTKVREKLMSKKTMLERSEKARQFREQKKHGKKMQQEIMQQKRSEKKQMLEALKKTKKGKADVAKLLENKQEMRQQNTKRQEKKNFRRKSRINYKNEKYGYGGQKKRSKYNTADSSSFVPGMGKATFLTKGSKQGGFSRGKQGDFSRGKQGGFSKEKQGGFSKGKYGSFGKGKQGGFSKGKRPKSTRRRR